VNRGKMTMETKMNRKNQLKRLKNIGEKQ